MEYRVKTVRGKCQDCKGAGKVEHVDYSKNLHQCDCSFCDYVDYKTTKRKCARCNGTGKKRGDFYIIAGLTFTGKFAKVPQDNRALMGRLESMWNTKDDGVNRDFKYPSYLGYKRKHA